MTRYRVERPTSITVICILMAIGALVAIPLALAARSTTLALPSWYAPFVLFSAAVGLVSMAGLWQMKKWAVYLYATMFVVAQMALVVGKVCSPIGAIIPIVYIAIMTSKLSEMD